MQTKVVAGSGALARENAPRTDTVIVFRLAAAFVEMLHCRIKRAPVLLVARFPELSM